MNTPTNNNQVAPTPTTQQSNSPKKSIMDHASDTFSGITSGITGMFKKKTPPTMNKVNLQPSTTTTVGGKKMKRRSRKVSRKKKGSKGRKYKKSRSVKTKRRNRSRGKK